MIRQTVKWPLKLLLTTLLFICTYKILPESIALAAKEELDQGRIKEIAEMLEEKPAGFGRPITERNDWEKLAKNDSFKSVISEAERLLRESIPEQPDDLYLEFSRTGNRTRWQRVAGRRRGRISTLVLAECIENKGRFLPAFDEIVREICSERTWVMPAHDRSLTNFKGTSVDIDLGSSMLAWSLGTADYLVADRLNPDTRRLIRDNLEKRIFKPYEDMVHGKRNKNWWMTGTNNWNAVCLGSVTGPALAVIESPHRRALYIFAAEKYSKNFLKGFTADGYCSEGLGYWNYGFGYYIMLSETIYQATKGKVDLLRDPEIKQIASFGSNIEILNDIYPAFADCSVRAQPGSHLMYFVSRRFGLGLRRWEQIDTVSTGSLYHSMMYSFANSASRTAPAQIASKGPGIRSWFDEAGVLICRPSPDSSSRLAVALKGGHNAEHHNHNDVGSFIVVLGDKPLLLDPGGEVYTARTFSGRRYESNVLNSYGHPVPIVAGKLQRTGIRARGHVVSKTFTDSVDTLVLDISSAYNVPELKKLERKYVYSRLESGSLHVTDEVEFSKPCEFGTALITFRNWKQTSPSTLMVYDSKEALRVEIKVAGADFEIRPETIKEDVSARKQPIRLGINLKKAVSNAAVSLTITPTKPTSQE